MSGKIQTKVEAKAEMLQMIGVGFGILTRESMFDGVPLVVDMPIGELNSAGNMEFKIPEDWSVARHGGPNNMNIVNGDDIGKTLCRWCTLVAAPPVLYWLGIDLEKQKTAIEAW